jgi:hypothetical protein
MGAVVMPVLAIDGLPQVVRTVWPHLLPGLLGLVAGPGQIAVQQRRGDPLPQEGAHGAHAHPVLLALRMIGREHHGTRGHLGLVDRWHRLRVAGQPESTHENCGVLTAGIWTTVTWTLLPSCMSSVRRDSVNTLIVCFTPQ